MGKFDFDRFKVQLKLAINRINTCQLKHQNMTGGRRKEIADALRLGNEDRARILTRYLIRDDYISEAYETLQIMCDDLVRSANLILQEKEMDSFLAPIIKSLCWAAPRIDAPELLRVRDQLIVKYGKSLSNIDPAEVDPRLVVKLAVRQPDSDLIERYLQAIAQSFNIEWSAPTHLPSQDLSFSNDAGGIAGGATSGPSQFPLKPTTSLIEMEAPPPSYTTVYPSNFPSLQPGTSSPRTGNTPTQTSLPSAPPEFEELTRRFDALKQNRRQ